MTEMTSTSSVGQVRIVLQFGLTRDINGAARDVEAAINAARADPQTSLRSNPTYRKVNPAEAPILILALTSDTLTRGQMYDAATNVLSQKLSQVDGIGQVIIGGAALPAVRVELNPTALFKYGIGLEDVRAALASANANSPKGSIDTASLHYQLYTNDQATHAADDRPLVIAYRNGAAVRLSDLADVEDCREFAQCRIVAGQAGGAGHPVPPARREHHLHRGQREGGDPATDGGSATGHEFARRQRPHHHDPGEPARYRNDADHRRLPGDGRVFLFLRSGRATIIPAVAVPVSIIGTFGMMYLLGYSLDNLSLMALTVATGFVVDDAIVVLENISRHMEEGIPRVQAALLGAKEVGFTVFSISISLIAVFLPIMLMGGIVGQFFQEFAYTLSLAILVSLAISLTTTPMMCALFLKPADRSKPKRRTLFDRAQALYGGTLSGPCAIHFWCSWFCWSPSG